jgi:hypothetical protein
VYFDPRPAPRVFSGLAARTKARRSGVYSRIGTPSSPRDATDDARRRGLLAAVIELNKKKVLAADYRVEIWQIPFIRRTK